MAKNIERFGWHLYNAEEHIETTTTDHYESDGSGRWIEGEFVREWKYKGKTTETKTRVYMDFCRNTAWYTNLPSVFLLEFLFNILVLVRRILGFLLLLFIPACILAIFLGGGQVFAIYETPLPQLFAACFFGWLGLIIAEEIVSFSASKILKPNIRR
ncbi:MAG: hypothetical protein IJ012_07205 [Clostridia bacterium]|nr:hypothetical protein [Clostridia bacterium]